MTDIILDTCAIQPSYRLDSARLQAIFKAAKESGDHVVFPQLVIDELVNNFRDDLEKSYVLYRKKHGELSRMLARPIPDEFLDIDQETRAYGDWLNAKVEKGCLRKLNYPYVSHEKVVARALGRRRPFDNRGKAGYRDTILCESILLHAREDGTEVFFVSPNTNDFSDPQERKALHPELRSELESIRIHSPAHVGQVKHV